MYRTFGRCGGFPARVALVNRTNKCARSEKFSLLSLRGVRGTGISLASMSSSKSWTALQKDALPLPVIEKILSQPCVPAIVFKDCEPHTYLLYISQYTISPHVPLEALDNPFLHVSSILMSNWFSCLYGESDFFNTKFQCRFDPSPLPFTLTLRIHIEDGLFKSFFINPSLTLSTSCRTVPFPKLLKVKFQVTSVQPKSLVLHTAITTVHGEQPICTFHQVIGYADPQTRKLTQLENVFGSCFRIADSCVPARVVRPTHMGDVTAYEMVVRPVHIDGNGHGNISVYLETTYRAFQKRLKEQGVEAARIKSATISFVGESFLGDRIECVAFDEGSTVGRLREFGACVFKREGGKTTESANARVTVEIEQAKY